ncbi:hypothetical protein AVEN_247932-1 [Araneus ventricosus]|uniref:Uncharacterized protein n=1 Tax=Araneus ventricosus TaxID=182803 RepID=A0A4Y2CJZ9_ARAVE|nr:hypothetical protein AVEN_247932-1 [Araneus ventricosus]
MQPSLAVSTRTYPTQLVPFEVCKNNPINECEELDFDPVVGYERIIRSRELIPYHRSSRSEGNYGLPNESCDLVIKHLADPLQLNF